MNLFNSRVKGMLLQELYMMRRSLEMINDIILMTIMTLIVFGFQYTYLSTRLNFTVGAKYLILGIILWEVLRIAQYTVSVTAMWNLWSNNLSNLFITPLSIRDYLVGVFVSSIVKSLLVFLVISTSAIFFFHFNIFEIGLVNLLLYYINLIIFSWWFGIVVMGLIFRFGTKIQSLTWALLGFFQPLMAVFFPLDILPSFMQKIALCLPLTHIFQAARANLIDSRTDWTAISIATLENLIYFVVSIYLFNYLFKKSKETGQFARNEV